MLEVIDAGGLTTIQDAGRQGWRRFGVPASGPMDEFALCAANLLVGNTAEAAALETGGGDLVLRATRDCVIGVTGAGYDLTVNTWKYPLWGSYFVRGGWSIQLGKLNAGMWAYLAVAGGLEAQPVLGSRATYLRGRFGGMDGRSLLEGDTLDLATPGRDLMEMAGRTLSEAACPTYGVRACGGGRAGSTTPRLHGREPGCVSLQQVPREHGLRPDGVQIGRARTDTTHECRRDFRGHRPRGDTGTG